MYVTLTTRFSIKFLHSRILGTMKGREREGERDIKICTFYCGEVFFLYYMKERWNVDTFRFLKLGFELATLSLNVLNVLLLNAHLTR